MQLILSRKTRPLIVRVALKPVKEKLEPFLQADKNIQSFSIIKFQKQAIIRLFFKEEKTHEEVSSYFKPEHNLRYVNSLFDLKRTVDSKSLIHYLKRGFVAGFVGLMLFLLHQFNYFSPALLTLHPGLTIGLLVASTCAISYSGNEFFKTANRIGMGMLVTLSVAAAWGLSLAAFFVPQSIAITCLHFHTAFMIFIFY